MLNVWGLDILYNIDKFGLIHAIELSNLNFKLVIWMLNGSSDMWEISVQFAPKIMWPCISWSAVMTFFEVLWYDGKQQIDKSIANVKQFSPKIFFLCKWATQGFWNNIKGRGTPLVEGIWNFDGVCFYWHSW